MNINPPKEPRTHGTGEFDLSQLKKVGKNVVLERGVLVFHPEGISFGDHVYIGHNTILKGYHNSEFLIGDHTWIGQGCFMHSAGGIRIGRAVGIGPNVKILTSEHVDENLTQPVLFQKLKFAPVVIEDGADIGIGSIILPGITIGEGAIVGAGSVVTKDVLPFTVVAGNPARMLRKRGE